MIFRRNISICANTILLFASALLVSCESPREKALRDLSESGVEASGRSLVEAVTERRPKIASLLLETGVYTEQRDSLGRTPLGIAVHQGDVFCAFMLLDSGANVNATMQGSASILGGAVKRGDPVMVETLLANGARTDGLMPGGEKILPWAIRKGRLSTVRAMIKAGADPHLKDRSGNPLLHVAMRSGHRDLTESLIELGADPGAAGANGETTIHLALRQEWIDIIPKLAGAGADTNAIGPDGRTLLEQATDDGDLDRIRLLLRCGADPNRWHDPAVTVGPLQRVFEHPQSDLLKLFLKHGAEPPGGCWEPWLWQTYQKRDHEKTRLLLSHGARIPATIPGRLSLVETAALAGEASTVKILLDYGLPAGRSLFFTCANGASDMASLLLSCGVSVDATVFPSRETPLIAAIRGGHDRIAEQLLHYGANPSHRPGEGQSLFHLAVATGCPRVLRHLLENGADPDAVFSRPLSPEFRSLIRPGIARWALKNDRNVTPLMVASDSGNIGCARALIKAGANTNSHTRVAKLWPINFAARQNDVRMMRLFLGANPYREDRVIEINLSEQRARIYDSDGKEIFTTKVSTGRKGYATPAGEYAITNKYRHWTSTLYHASMPYFQRFSCGDFGMHQGYVPDYPASHGCIRVPSGNASKLFSMTRRGDRVRIIP